VARLRRSSVSVIDDPRIERRHNDVSDEINGVVMVANFIRVEAFERTGADWLTPKAASLFGFDTFVRIKREAL
jgi:hypothetical protein